MQKDQGLQRLPQIVAGRGEKAGFDEIGLFRRLLRGSALLLRAPVIGDVVEYHQSSPASTGGVWDLLRSDDQDPFAERRHIDLDFASVGAPGTGDAVEERAQRRHVEMVRVGLRQRPAGRIARGGAEEAIERSARRYDPHRLVEDDQRLADGVDDPFGIGARGPALLLECLDRGDFAQRNDDPFDAIVLGAVGRGAVGVPGARCALDLAPHRREISEHGVGVGDQIEAGKRIRQIGERAAHIRGE